MSHCHAWQGQSYYILLTIIKLGHNGNHTIRYNKTIENCQLEADLPRKLKAICCGIWRSSACKPVMFTKICCSNDRRSSTSGLGSKPSWCCWICPARKPEKYRKMMPDQLGAKRTWKGKLVDFHVAANMERSLALTRHFTWVYFSSVSDPKNCVFISAPSIALDLRSFNANASLRITPSGWTSEPRNLTHELNGKSCLMFMAEHMINICFDGGYKRSLIGRATLTLFYGEKMISTQLSMIITITKWWICPKKHGMMKRIPV